VICFCILLNRNESWIGAVFAIAPGVSLLDEFAVEALAVRQLDLGDRSLIAVVADDIYGDRFAKGKFRSALLSC